MKTASDLVAAIDVLDDDTLFRWVELGWVRPQTSAEGLRFDQSDVTRLELICELHFDLQIEEDSLAVVLSLMDQLYATRRALGTVLSVIEEQPAETRGRITALVEARL